MNTSSGDIIISAIPEKNPMRISAIITRILKLLPLRDIKNGRLICREWNSLAEPLLRKKAKIVITPKFGASDYFDYYSNSRLSTLPFTAFKFYNYVDSTKGLMVSDFDCIFNKCGRNIKEVEFEDCFLINLACLPQTIEKLKIRKSECAPKDTVIFNLPNLKYLHLDQTTGRGGLESASLLKEILSWFKNCSNLVELHLESLGRKCELDVAWLPKTVKRLKLRKVDDIKFVADSPAIDVDVLMLDSSIVSSEVELLMEKIKPKILVKLVGFDIVAGWGGKEKAEDFISFVRKNTQLEKIVINTLYGLGKESSPGKVSFLEFAGEESQCYEFNNQKAKPMPKEEFKNKYYELRH